MSSKKLQHPWIRHLYRLSKNFSSYNRHDSFIEPQPYDSVAAFERASVCDRPLWRGKLNANGGNTLPYDLVIKNARLVNEGTIIEGDLAIESGRIVQIGGSLSAANELDAVGSWLIPGMIDDQVHFREPGFEHKGSIETESRAAIAGGVTSYMEMPNSNPQTTNAEALQRKYDRAAKHSFANYGFYLGATNDNLEDIKSIDPSSACGIKVFMGASTGNMLVDDPDTLNGIFSSAPVLIATHCENTPMKPAHEKNSAATSRSLNMQTSARLKRVTHRLRSRSSWRVHTARVSTYSI